MLTIAFTSMERRRKKFDVDFVENVFLMEKFYRYPYGNMCERGQSFSN